MRLSFHNPLPHNNNSNDNKDNYQEARFTHQYTAHVLTQDFPTILEDQFPTNVCNDLNAAEWLDLPAHILLEPRISFCSGIIREQEAARNPEHQRLGDEFWI